MSRESRSPAQPPETDDHLEIEPPKDKAAGFFSIRSTFAHMHRQGHTIPSAIRILGRMNQKDGFRLPRMRVARPG